MQINLVYDRSVNNAPPEFITALNAAAEYLDGLILNPITVNVEVGYGEDAGQPLNADELGEGGPRFTTLAYSQITPDLTVGNLPAGDPTLGAGVDVSFAEEQAWGIAPAHTGQIDGSVDSAARDRLITARQGPSQPTSMISWVLPSTN